MTAEYQSLIEGVRDGALEPEQALLGAMLVRARLDARGEIGPTALRVGERHRVRVRLSAEALEFMESDEYRAALALLNLEAM